MDRGIKQSKRAMKKWKKGKGDFSYRKKLINEAIDDATDALRRSMPKYMRTPSGYLVNLHDMLA